MAEESMGKVWWHYPKCPREEDCTPENFKKWRCWGDSEEEAQAALYKHLTESGKHFLTHQEADEEVRENEAVQCHLPMPRQDQTKITDIRGETEMIITRPLPKRDAVTDRGDGPRQKQEPAKRLRSPSPGQPAGSGRAGSSSGPSASTVVAVPRVMMPPQNEPTVTLRMQEFNTIIDSIQRTSQAAKQAGRIASVAASAFANEARILDEIAANMQTMKSAAEFAAQADR
jgi:hypothetical protein